MSQVLTVLERPLPEKSQYGLVLRRIRERQRLTQGQVAERLGMSERGYGHWEAGRSEPSLSDLPQLAAALGVSLGELCAELERAEGRERPGRVRPSLADRVAADLARGWRELPKEEQDLIWRLVQARRELRERVELAEEEIARQDS